LCCLGKLRICSDFIEGVRTVSKKTAEFNSGPNKNRSSQATSYKGPIVKLFGSNYSVHGASIKSVIFYGFNQPTNARLQSP
jgi:hypothetical protein